jgi:hypothetical protein
LPAWLAISLSVVAPIAAIAGLVARWWTSQPQPRVRFKGYGGDVGKIHFPLLLGDSGPKVAEDVIVMAYLGDECVGQTDPVDVAPHTAFRNYRQEITLRRPEQAELVSGAGPPDFHGRTFTARVRARNSRREGQADYLDNFATPYVGEDPSF